MNAHSRISREVMVIRGRNYLPISTRACVRDNNSPVFMARIHEAGQHRNASIITAFNTTHYRGSHASR